jgi:hypothetical protein
MHGAVIQNSIGRLIAINRCSSEKKPPPPSQSFRNRNRTRPRARTRFRFPTGSTPAWVLSKLRSAELVLLTAGIENDDEHERDRRVRT